MATATTPETVEKTIFEALPQFGVEESEITRESTFEELDVDSLDLAELAQVVEDEHGIVMEPDDMKQIRTVGDAIDYITEKKSLAGSGGR